MADTTQQPQPQPTGTNGTAGAAPPTARPKRKRPVFTDEQLRCILDEFMHIAWQREKFYDERREVLALLRAYFAP